MRILRSTAACAARCHSRVGFATWVFAAVVGALVSGAAAKAQPTGPLVADRLLIQGARLSVAPGDEAQTLNVAETATVRTCYAGVCGSMAAGDSRVAGLVVKGELSGPELSEPMTYTAIPGGAFVLPGFQAEGTYLLANLRLVRAESGEILGNATPAVAVLEVRNILLASATVRQLTLDELRARGIEITQQNYQAFSFAVGFAFQDSPVTIEFPVLFQEGGQVELLSKPTVHLDELPGEVAAILRRWQPPHLIPFMLEVAEGEELQPGKEKEELPPDTRLFGVIVLPGNVSFLNQFFDARLLVANGAPAGSGAVLTSVTGAIRLPAAVPRELLRLAKTSPAVVPGQRVPVLNATGGGDLGPGEQGAASFSLEGLVPGTHVVTMEIGAELERAGRDPLPLAGKLKAAVEVVDARFNLAFNHPDVVREGEPYTLYVTVTNLSRATQNLVTVELDQSRITGAHQERPADDFSPTISTLEPGEGQTLEYRLVSDTTGRCVATTFQSNGPVEGVIQLRTGVGEQGIPLSPSSLVLPRFTELLPDALVRPNVRLLGLAYSLAVAPPGSIPQSLPRVVSSDVERRAVDLAEAGQRLYLGDEPLSSLETLLLDQLGSRHDLPEYDQLRRTLTKGRDAAEALASLLRQEQEAKDFSASALLGHVASTMSYSRPWLAATLESAGAGEAPTLEARKLNGITGVTYLAYSGGDSRALRSLPFGEIYDILDRPGGSPTPLAVIGRLSSEAGYAFVVHGPSTGSPMPVNLTIVAPSPSGSGFVRVDLSSLTVPAGEAWAVQAVLPAGSSRSLTFELVHLATGFPVAGAPAPVVRPVDLPPFALVGARQDFVLDPYGSGVWYLFNRPPVRADAEAEDRYAVETHFRGLDTTSSGAALERSILFEAASALWQPSSERVVAVRFAQPVSAISALHEGQPVVSHTHHLDAPGLRDTFGNSLSSLVPAIQVEGGHVGGLVEGTVLRGTGDAVVGANVRLVRDRVIPNDAGGDPLVLHDVVAERTTGADGTFFFPFIEEPILSVPRPREKGGVQSGFRIRAIVPPGPDPLAPEETEEVSSIIRLQSRLARISIALLGRGSVTGQVLYDNGDAVAGAAVTAASTLFSEVRSAVADTGGIFRVDGLPVGPITLTARDATGRSAFATVALGAPGASATVTLRLERTQPVRTGTVTGWVQVRRDSASGSSTDPASGATVAVYSAGAPYGQATTGSTGSFRFESVPAGRVTVQAADFSISRAPALVDLDLAPDATEDVTLTLAASNPRTVVGRILFHDPLTQVDIPVPGATVFVEGPGNSAVTNAEGDYRIDGVQAQGAGEIPYCVHAIDFARSTEGTTLVAVTDASPDPVVAATIVLTSTSPGAIDGVVLDPLGRPAPGVTVTLLPIGKTTTGADGAFSFEGVPLSDYTVVAHKGTGLESGAIGWIGAAGTRVLFGGHRAFVTVRLRGAGTVNVRTRTASAGVRSPVAYKPTWFSPQELVIRQKSAGIEATTDDDGRLSLALPVGPLSITATNPFHGTASFQGSIDFAGQVKDVDLLFQESSTVTGIVVDVDGITPVPDIDVELGANGLLPQRQRSDALGAFRFELVPPGVVSVTALGLRGAIERTGRTYGQISEPGQVLDLVVRLKPKGTVRGHVVDETTLGVFTPLAGAQVFLQENDFPFRRLPASPGFLSAGNDGRFEFAGVAAGRFTVVARDPGQVARQGSRYGELNADFEVVDIGAVALSGQVADLSVLVRDPENGSPVPDAQVFLSNGEATVAGADGRAFFPALPLGTWAVHAFHAPTGRGGRLGDIHLATAGQELQVVVVLDQRGRISGVLFDDEARTVPVGGGMVHLEGTVNGRLWGASLTAMASTSREPGSVGTFAFDGLPVATYGLTAGVEGSARRASESVTLTPTAPDAQIALVLEPVRDVWVRLHQKEQVRGLVEINPDPVSGDGVFAVVCNRSGAPPVNLLAPEIPYPGHAFGFEEILATRSFEISAQEASGELRRAFVTSGTLASGSAGAGTSADPYRLVLLARGTVRVTVRDAGGVLVAGATVRVHASNGTFETATDGSGRAAFTAVEEGQVTVSAHVPASTLGASASRTLQWDDQVLDVDLTLSPVVSAHGVVYEAPEGDAWDGNVAGLTPAAGIAVRIHPAAGAEQLLLTAADGTFQFSALSPGAYTIEAQSLDGERIASAAGSLGSAHGTDYALAALVLDASRPRIVSLTPPNGEPFVSRTAPVEIVFSEPLASTVLPSGPASAYFQLAYSGTPAAGVWSSTIDVAGRQVVRFTPNPRYENSTIYSLLVKGGSGGVRDREGRPLTDSGDIGSSFTTSDTDGPRVVGTLPSLARPVDPEASIRIDFGEVLVLTPAQINAAVLFEWRNLEGVWAAFPVTTSLTRGGYSILVAPPQGVTFAGDSLRRRLTVSGLTDAFGNPMPAWVGEYRIYDTNAPALTIGLPPNAPGGDLAASASYTLTPAFDNLDDVMPENLFGDVDRVEYTFASAADPSQPAASPGVVMTVAPFALGFVAAYSGDGVSARPFPVWVKAFDTSGNPSGQVRLDMRILPNTPPVVGSIAVAATSPVPGVLYAGSSLAATASGIADADDARLTLSAELRRTIASGSEQIATAPARALDRPADGWPALPQQAFSFVVPISEAEGSSLFVRVLATDTKGAQASADAPFVVADDATAPVVTDLVARRPNGDAATSFLIGDTFVLEVRARDLETAVRSVSIATTGGALPPTLVATRVDTSDLFSTPSVTVPSSLTGPVSVGVTATGEDSGGNSGFATATLDLAPSSDPTHPVAEWLSPFEGALWPAAYASVDAGKSGVDLLLRVRVTDKDLNGTGQEIPGAYVNVKVRGPIDASGTLATEWTPAALLSNAAGEWVYEAAWRIPNGVAAGVSLPFEVEVIDAGANRAVRPVTLLVVPARYVYESATTSVVSASDVPKPAGAESLPVFLLDGTTLSLYPPTAGGVRSFESLHLYSGGAWSAGAGSAVTVRRTTLTSPEVTFYDSLVPYYPLELSIGGTLAVGHGAAIDVTGRGLLGGDGSHDPVTQAGERGPAPGAAGSHGGMGHPAEGEWTARLQDPGSVYGNIRDPHLPGSGGGHQGGSGGGVVRVHAPSATVRLFGDITADGGAAPSGDLVGAAGGSARLQANRIEGRGRVCANGSSTVHDTSRPGGGGGRVSVSWVEPEALTVTGHAEGGVSSLYNPSGTSRAPRAGAGTVFFERLDVSGAPLDRGLLRISSPASAYPPATTPLPGLGTATVVAVDTESRTLTVRSASAVGSIEGESVVVSAAPSGGGSPTIFAFPVSTQQRAGGSVGSPDQAFTLTVDANPTELAVLSTSVSGGATLTAKARLRFASLEAVGPVRVVSSDELQVAGVVDNRVSLEIGAGARILLGGETPAIEFTGTSPAPNTSVARGTTLDVHFRVTDPLGISMVEETWSGTGTTSTRTLDEPLEVVPPSSPIRVTVPVAQPAGPVTYRVRATDRAGRVTESIATWNVVGDVTAPTINSITFSPERAGDTYEAGTMVAISATASDDGGVSRVRIEAFGGIEERAGASATLYWPVPPVSQPSAFVVTAVATDLAGNSTTSTKTINATPHANGASPSLKIDCPTADAILPSGYSHLVVEATASDDEGVQRIDFYRDAEVLPFAVLYADYGDRKTFSAAASGTSLPVVSEPTSVRFRARAIDFAGNVSAEVETVVTVVPAVELLASGTNDWAALEDQTSYLATGTLVLDQPRTLGGLLVLRGAAVTHPAGSDRSLTLTVKGALFIECGAAIDATGQGHPPGSTFGGPVDAIHGPSSHLGMGGEVESVGTSSFGGVARPAEAGGAEYEAAGGGVIRIRAARVVLGGNSAAIRANGSQWGAAGGSVWITAASVEGDGTIEASGADGYDRYNYDSGIGGGGGAVALEFDSVSEAVRGRIRSGGGLSRYKYSSSPNRRSGGAGTVFLRGPGATHGTVRVDNEGVRGSLTVLPALGAGTAQIGSAGTKLVTDRSASIPSYFVGHWVEVRRGESALGSWKIEAVQGQSLTLAPAEGETLDLSPGDTWTGAYRFDAVEVAGYAALRSDDPIRTTSAELSGPTTSTVFDTEITMPLEAESISVAGNVSATALHATNLTVRSGGRLTHPASSTTATSELEVHVGGVLTIEAGGAIDATGRGLPGEYAQVNVAGSHLGLATAGAIPFGSVRQPQEPGEGGRGWTTSGAGGGGVIRIRTGVLSFGDSTSSIRADGASATYGLNYFPAGAGGSVWITASTINGDGWVGARGGSGAYSGGGGAVVCEYEDATGTALSRITTLGGGNGTQRGGAGTVVLKGPADTLGRLIVDNGGVIGGHSSALPALGKGTAQAGTGAATLVTDRAASIPPYFVGHWVEIARNGNALGTWRVRTIVDKTVTLEPNDGESIGLQQGDQWQGVYRFDSVTVGGGAVLSSADPIRDRLPTISISSPSAQTIVSSGASIPVTFAATDDRAIVNVTLTLGSSSVVIPGPSPTSGTVRAPWLTTTSTLALVATVLDLGGQSVSTSVTLTILAAPPLTATIVAPVSGTALFGGTNEVVGVQIPDGRPVRNLTVTLGSSTSTYSGGTGPRLNVALPIPVVSSDETRVLVAIVEDDLGGTVSSAPVSVTVLADSNPRVTSSVNVGSPVSAGSSVRTDFTGVFRDPGSVRMTLRVTGSVAHEQTVYTRPSSISGAVTVLDAGQVRTGSFSPFVIPRDARGPMTINVTAVDSAGRTGSAVPILREVVEPQNVAPTVEFDDPTAPAGATVAGGDMLYASVSVNDDGPMTELAVTLGPTTERLTNPAKGFHTLNVPVPVVTTDQTLDLTARVVDDLGLVGTAGPVPIRILTSAIPRVTATAAPAGPYEPGGSITLSYEALAIRGALTATLTVSGALTHTESISLSGENLPISGSFAPIVIPAGVHGHATAVVRVTDYVEQTGSSADLSLQIGPESPLSATLAGPATAAPGSDLELVLTATDDIGLRSARLSISGAFEYARLITLGPTGAGEATNVTRTIRVPVPASVLGSATAQVDATDSDGNSVTSSTVGFDVVDTTAPVVARVRSPQWAFVSGTYCSFSADVTDNGRISEVRFFVDGEYFASAFEPWQRSTYEVMGYLLPTVSEPLRLHLRVEAVDNAGVVGSAERDFTVLPAGTPPARFIAPTSGAMAIGGETVPLVVNVDHQRPIVQAAFFRDGEATPFATRTDGGMDSEFVVPESAAPETDISLRVEVTDDHGAVGRASTVVRIIAGNILENGTIIERDDPSHEDQTVIVRGGVTVRGHHRFSRLLVLPGGELAHDGSEGGTIQELDIEVSGDAHVSREGRLNGGWRGFEGGLQSTNSTETGLTLGGLTGASAGAGGSHGGVGEPGSSSGGGPVYGSVRDPRLPGSGGGADGPTRRGGSGGGVIRLAVGGRLVVDGEVHVGGYDGDGGGAGAGGSAHISAATLGGTGGVLAFGGSPWARAGSGGGAGGGRIALDATLEEGGPEAVTASGSQWFAAGAPGTTFYSAPADRKGHLVLDSQWAEQTSSTQLVSIGAGEVTNASGRTFQGTATSWVPGVEGLFVEIRRGADFVGRFFVDSVDSVSQTILLEADAGGQIRAGDLYQGVQSFDSVSVRGRARLTTSDVLEGRVFVDSEASLSSANVDVPPQDAAPTISASIPSPDVHAGDSLAVTVQSYDDVSLNRLVLWVHGYDASTLEVPITGSPTSDTRTVTFVIPSLPVGQHFLGIGVRDGAEKWTSTLLELHVLAPAGATPTSSSSRASGDGDGRGRPARSRHPVRSIRPNETKPGPPDSLGKKPIEINLR